MENNLTIDQVIAILNACVNGAAIAHDPTVEGGIVLMPTDAKSRAACAAQDPEADAPDAPALVAIPLDFKVEGNLITLNNIDATVDGLPVYFSSAECGEHWAQMNYGENCRSVLAMPKGTMHLIEVLGRKYSLLDIEHIVDDCDAAEMSMDDLFCDLAGTPQVVRGLIDHIKELNSQLLQESGVVEAS